MRRRQSSEKTVVARHVRPAGTARVQHRPVAVPDGVPVGRGPAIRRRHAVRAGGGGHAKMEIQAEGGSGRGLRQRDGDGGTGGGGHAIGGVATAAAASAATGGRQTAGRRGATTVGRFDVRLVTGVGQRPGLAQARRRGRRLGQGVPVRRLGRGIAAAQGRLLEQVRRYSHHRRRQRHGPRRHQRHTRVPAVLRQSGPVVRRPVVGRGRPRAQRQTQRPVPGRRHGMVAARLNGTCNVRSPVGWVPAVRRTRITYTTRLS